MKILIAGIGGVGGYFGGLLAKRFEHDPAVRIYFLARGAHLAAIRETGLNVIKGNESWTVHPAFATDDPAAIGVMDWILFCTKGYDLEETAMSLAPCISPGTVILPLLNGVDASDRIRSVLPDADVIEGCVYIIARLKAPGVVENGGSIQLLYFGKQGVSDDRLHRFEKICKQAGVEVTLTDRIREVTWEKFIFISPLATITSRYNIPIGKVREDHGGELYQLICEVRDLAIVKGIALPEDIVERTVHKINGLGYQHTSSMHSDYQKENGRTEVESLTGFVVRESEQCGLAATAYKNMYHALLTGRHRQ